MKKTKFKTGTSCRNDLRKAISQTSACKSDHSCLELRTCFGKPVCKALGPLAATAGFIAPTESSESCGYCVPAYRGFVCFCPTRWALFRNDASPG